MEFIFQLLTVFILVLLNGYFVAAEFALIAVRKTRIDELVKKGGRAAKLVQKAQDEIDSYISSTQLGITVASLALGWIGEPALAHFFEPFFQFLPKDFTSVTAHTLAVAVAFSLITVLHIVLGELAPKTVALQKSEGVALFVIAPLTVFTKVAGPFIFVLNGMGDLVLKMFGFKAPSRKQLAHSEEEIKMILAQSVEGGVIEKGEADMVTSVLSLGDISVKQIMIPRTEVIAFNMAASLERMIARVEHHPHSRFPVYEHSIDKIVGFIHIKDVYKILIKDGGQTKISDTSLTREIIKVPEIKRIDDVLLEMRKKRVHIAIVEDEYGGTAGIVTLEDIIESLVGEIEDEFENPRPQILKEKDGTYLVDGLTPLDQVKKKLTLPVKGQGYSTIGGFTFGLLGREAKKGDTIVVGDVSITVEEIVRNRIKTLRLKKKKYKK